MKCDPQELGVRDKDSKTGKEGKNTLDTSILQDLHESLTKYISKLFTQEKHLTISGWKDGGRCFMELNSQRTMEIWTGRGPWSI